MVQFWGAGSPRWISCGSMMKAEIWRGKLCRNRNTSEHRCARAVRFRHAAVAAGCSCTVRMLTLILYKTREMLDANEQPSASLDREAICKLNSQYCRPCNHKPGASEYECARRLQPLLKRLPCEYLCPKADCRSRQFCLLVTSSTAKSTPAGACCTGFRRLLATAQFCSVLLTR